MTDETPPQEVPTKVECPAESNPAVRLFIFAAIALVIGIYCFIDHYVRGKYPYPEPYDLNKYLGYLFNAWGPWVLIPIGLICLILGVASLRRRLVADAEGIGYVGKPKIPWSAVTSLDTAKLGDKGILGVNYEVDGVAGQLKLDSWTLQNFRELVALVESKVAPAADEGG